ALAAIGPRAADKAAPKTCDMCCLPRPRPLSRSRHHSAVIFPAPPPPPPANSPERPQTHRSPPPIQSAPPHRRVTKNRQSTPGRLAATARNPRPAPPVDHITHPASPATAAQNPCNTGRYLPRDPQTLRHRAALTTDNDCA